jgi:hypothetical protein
VPPQALEGMMAIYGLEAVAGGWAEVGEIPEARRHEFAAVREDCTAGTDCPMVTDGSYPHSHIIEAWHGGNVGRQRLWDMYLRES